VLGFLVLVAHGGLWARLGIEHFPDRPYFLDLVAVLAAGQAHAAGLDVYVPPNPFDPFGRPHVYGPWWLVTGVLGLTVADARWLGPLLALAFIATAAAMLAPRRAGAAAVALALLASPPVLLGLERGNNDLVVFLLLVAAGALLARREILSGLAGASLVWLAAALKIYPVAVLPMLGARATGRRHALARLVVVGAGCVAVFGVWRADFAHAADHRPAPDTIFAYGLSVLHWMVVWPALVPESQRVATVAAQWIAFGATLIGAAWWLRRQARALWTLVPPTGATAAWFVAGGMGWCACWLANTNYAYRAVLLLLPVRLWLARAFFSAAASEPEQRAGPNAKGGVQAAQDERTISRGLLAKCAVAFWLTPIKAALLTGPFAALGMTLGVEQALMLALTAALLTSLTGWAWRRWQQVP
jgi:hypothetical protein